MHTAAEIANELIASGLNPAQTLLLFELVLILSAVSADASSDNRGGPLESTVEQARKERDKQRKRADRAAAKAGKLYAKSSADSPRTVHGQALTLEDKEGGLPVEKEVKKGRRLLVGTRVSDEQRSTAVEWGCPPDRVDAVWTEFVDYWSEIPGQRGVRMTWLGTWRNWVKRIFGKSNGNGTGNLRTDPAAGRATARETQHVATMGGAALRYLQEGKSAGTGRDLPDGVGTADIVDLRKRTENAG